MLADFIAIKNLINSFVFNSSSKLILVMGERERERERERESKKIGISRDT